MTGLLAGMWGLVAGSALVIGATIGFYARVPQAVIAGVMAFGAGVLISALAFELMDDAFQRGGLLWSACGFFAGALAFTFANRVLARFGARHRKRSRRPAHAGAGSSAAIAVGALMDGIPESIVIGLSMLEGGAVSLVTVIAVFLSNVPEGLSSAAGMRGAGRSAAHVFSVWGGIMAVTGLAALAGYFLFDGLDARIIALATAIGAGAILAMLVDTMIPEAFAQDQDYAGIITAAGFVVSFALSKGLG
ncbi:ZIP family metal transporter [Afifella pfennigii]|uniref:ZIP family metal transporter n=1 Tax=Afifella pfennigii TaxID=209897 RepID=UPI00047BC388|nr:ZIP family zinc transporter [Afifella pfennigii]